MQSMSENDFECFKPTFAAFNQGQIPTIACFNQATTPFGVDLDALIVAMQAYMATNVVPVWVRQPT